MRDADDSFDDSFNDDLVLAYIEQEQSPIKAQQVAVTTSKTDTLRYPIAKRDRKRSQSVSSTIEDGKSVRCMKPRVEAAVIVRLV